MDRFIELNWLLIEHKYRYYVMINPIITDYEFDMMEKEYRELAEELDVPPTASDMVGFDDSKFSSQLVINKLKGGGLNDLKMWKRK